MSGERLTFIALTVSNLEVSLRFYRDIVGVQEPSHDAELGDPWFGGPHAAISWTDGAFLHGRSGVSLKDGIAVEHTVDQRCFRIREDDALKGAG